MILQGNNLIVTASGQAGVALMGSKACTIDVKVDTIEVSSPTTGAWKTFLTKRKEWSVSTSHLITLSTFPLTFAQVGTTVILTFAARNGSVTYQFAGIYSGSVSNNRTTDPDSIYWHVTLGAFVAKKSSTYYRYWSYTDPDTEAESYFTTPSYDATYQDTSTGKRYAWTGREMEELKAFSGSAIVEQFEITARRGSLASGSFKFRGTGELSIVTPTPPSS